VGSIAALAQAPNKPAKEVISFSTLRAATPDAARSQALDWLKGAGRADANCMNTFDSVWQAEDKTVLERVGETLALGDPDAAQLLRDAADSSSPAPTEVPALLKDTKRPQFFRANLALAYARALAKRRVHEEALDALKAVKPEQVVEPATYLFYRAVSEHALQKKEDANRTITRLLDDAVDPPERYKLVATLMHLDMQSWKDKDLGWIARKMDNIERRLELARGGPQTQKMQKEVVARLDELIKQVENQAKGSSQANGGACPNGGNQQRGNMPGGIPNSPQKDSYGGKNAGEGNVDPKKLDAIAKQWGKLPDKERAKAMQELIRDMPPDYRELIENYFRKLAQAEASKP
jgi:hypothetical protein